MDRGYRVIFWNHAAESGTGFRASEVLGKNVFDVFPKASQALLGEGFFCIVNFTHGSILLNVTIVETHGDASLFCITPGTVRWRRIAMRLYGIIFRRVK